MKISKISLYRKPNRNRNISLARFEKKILGLVGHFEMYGVYAIRTLVWLVDLFFNQTDRMFNGSNSVALPTSALVLDLLLVPLPVDSLM